ncbi:NAD(P)H-binding protein [Streptomyces sp. NBC_01476]|uniref:NAD(P)-dependent oxidoreductase n=1 Tax=Streptomyces sp. NBC_01476 TaxID=2903881 RepID=UPI002E302384|nr:NAD(P)H-binding protein [Streptomyces sp. NBC_01476]
MKIVVFGASGATGRQVVSQALAAGHEVTAFVRDPLRAPAAHPALRVAVGQVTSDQEAVTGAVRGQDAVLSTLGTSRDRQGMLSPTVHAAALPVIVAAMRETGVRRVVYQSSLGVGESVADTPALLRLLYRPLARVFADKAAGEAALRAGGLEWTLVYPVMMTNGPRTRTYRTGEHLKLTGLPRVSRADVADFMLREAGAPAYPYKIAMITG